jgi:tetratricopeptide (TPR) repeat protein
MSILGSVTFYRAQYAEASLFLQECVDLSREFDDVSNLARSLAVLGISLWLAGDVERATDAMEEALQLSRQLGDPLALGMILMYLAEITHWQGQHERVSMYLREYLDLVGWPRNNRGLLVAAGLALLGRTAYLTGESVQARRCLVEGLEAVRASRLKGLPLAHCLESLAAVEGSDGQPIRAAHLFGAAQTWWLACGAVRHWPEREAYERDMSSVRAQLDESAFAAAWDEGRAMTLDQILDYALEDAPVEA